MRELRVDILKLCLGALLVTALASIYLSGTITRPILRLAAATERVRRGQRRIGGTGASRAEAAIPDMRGRGDEIGELSGALVDMTAALRQRLEEIERFAADVAHEIRNPLTSLKSAVETAARVQDPARRERLMQVIVEDVQRIDRLIGDISGASRLDAELSRATARPIDVARLLGTATETSTPWPLAKPRRRTASSPASAACTSGNSSACGSGASGQGGRSSRAGSPFVSQS
ncbi:MAG: histidine kinase dimerization/phospho-acceptor domain-containing protein [Alphaproteobacteria bacterium]